MFSYQLIKNLQPVGGPCDGTPPMDAKSNYAKEYCKKCNPKYYLCPLAKDKHSTQLVTSFTSINDPNSCMKYLANQQYQPGLFIACLDESSKKVKDSTQLFSVSWNDFWYDLAGGINTKN